MSIDTSRGYVAFPRGLTDWEWYDDINTSRVFFHLFLTANWEAKSWRGVVINPGDKVTSIAHLSEETGLTPREVRTALHHLTATNYLTIRTTRRFSVVSINNWTVLTGTDKLSDKQTTHCRHTGDMLATTTKPLKPLEPLKQSSSSKSPSEEDDEDAPAGATTETTISPESFWMENGLGKSITSSLKERLTEYRGQGVEDALIVQAMREAVEHNAAAPLPYMRKVLDQAVAAGELTLDAWRVRHRAYRPKGRVDRPEPSGNDFLRDAADRPRRLKRKD